VSISGFIKMGNYELRPDEKQAGDIPARLVELAII
jgi:hypothetical protein